jgi:hypothetical protein
VTNEELCQSISDVICDYRNSEFGNYDYDHVVRWISQFEEDEKQIVLRETNQLLQKNFISYGIFVEFMNTPIE